MHRVISSLLLALTACGTAQPEPSQQVLEDIVARYGEDPGAAIEAVAALPSEVERVMAVEALTLRHGATMLARGDCAALPGGAPSTRCAEILERAHLFSDRAAAPAVEPPDREPLRCDHAASPALCARAAALEALSAGEPEPHRHCEGIPTPTLRHECAFEIAEALVQREGPAGYASAVAACQAAGPFEPNCLDHLGALLARRVVDGWGGSCPRDLGGARLEPFGQTTEAILGAWQQDLGAARRPLNLFLEDLHREALLAAGSPPAVVVSDPPPWERDSTVLARWATGGLSLDLSSDGPGADPVRAQAARLSGLALVLENLQADVVLLQQIEDPRALVELQRATACLGGFRYPYLQPSDPAHAAGVLSRFPLSLHPDGVGVQRSPSSRAELVIPWGAPEAPFVWQSEAWQPDPAGPPEPSEHSLPFMLDPQGQPQPWNPSAKRGYSDRLPELLTLIRAAGSPR
jgi:hypothetical protein